MALHVVCASKWPGLDPARTTGLVSTARLLLDAGAGSPSCGMLLEAGASTEGLSLPPGDLKPPSAEVAELLRSFGVGAD